MKKIVLFLVISFILSICSIAAADIPHLINYQGKLTDSSGVPLNGANDITFRIYDAESGGNLLWTEPHTQSNGTAVTITKGIFSIMLGSVTNLNLAFDKPYFLGIQVGGDAEMTPRQQITSVGYAMKAEKADNLAIPNQVQGDILYYNGYSWTKLSAGTSGQVLKTQGTGANPVWTSISSRQLFTSDGIFTAPTGITTVYITMVAGGGNGGGNIGGGAGGGSGQSVINYPYSVVGGSNYTVVVGATASNSSFDTLIVEHGENASGQTPGNGGGAGNRSLGIDGGNGATPNSGGGGNGGGSSFGLGGLGKVGSGEGEDGFGYGAGGGGTGLSGPWAPGNGTQGFVLVEW